MRVIFKASRSTPKDKLHFEFEILMTEEVTAKLLATAETGPRMLTEPASGIISFWATFFKHCGGKRAAAPIFLTSGRKVVSDRLVKIAKTESSPGLGPFTRINRAVPDCSRINSPLISTSILPVDGSRTKERRGSVDRPPFSSSFISSRVKTVDMPMAVTKFPGPFASRAPNTLLFRQTRFFPRLATTAFPSDEMRRSPITTVDCKYPTCCPPELPPEASSEKIRKNRSSASRFISPMLARRQEFRRPT